MIRSMLSIVGVCWCATALAQEAEITPLQTLAEVAAQVEENVAAFDNFSCEFDVSIGLLETPAYQRDAKLAEVDGVGHGVWAKQGASELFDFRQEGESPWNWIGRLPMGPLIYTEGWIRSSDFDLLIHKYGIITSAPDPKFHPRMDPFALFHTGEGESNARLLELLRQFIKLQDAQAEVSFAATKTPDGRHFRYQLQTSERYLTLVFPTGSPGLPTFVSYATRSSDDAEWLTSRIYVAAAKTVEGVGVFPERIVVIYPSEDTLIWELKSLADRQPTAEELTYTADRDLQVMRAGIHRSTIVEQGQTITPDLLPELYKSLEYRPPEVTEQTEAEKNMAKP